MSALSFSIHSVTFPPLPPFPSAHLCNVMTNQTVDDLLSTFTYPRLNTENPLTHTINTSVTTTVVDRRALATSIAAAVNVNPPADPLHPPLGIIFRASDDALAVLQATYVQMINPDSPISNRLRDLLIGIHVAVEESFTPNEPDQYPLIESTLLTPAHLLIKDTIIYKPGMVPGQRRWERAEQPPWSHGKMDYQDRVINHQGALVKGRAGWEYKKVIVLNRQTMIQLWATASHPHGIVITSTTQGESRVTFPPGMHDERLARTLEQVSS